MTENELWPYIWKKKVAYTKPFDRDFVWILKKDFVTMENFFSKELNILHPGVSYRSGGYISHIHAIDQGEYVFAHRDIGNLAKFFPLGVLHLVFDVIPYMIWTKTKGISLESTTVCPLLKRNI